MFLLFYIITKNANYGHFRDFGEANITIKSSDFISVVWKASGRPVAAPSKIRPILFILFVSVRILNLAVDRVNRDIASKDIFKY